MFTKEGFIDRVHKLHEYEKATIKVIALLLGFYVSTMMSRWWGQIVKLPHLSDLAMELNGLTVPGKLFLIAIISYSKVSIVTPGCFRLLEFEKKIVLVV